MTALARIAATPDSGPAPAGIGFKDFVAEVHEDLTAIAGLWRTFQREAVGTPYQSFDFVRAYVGCLAAPEGFRARIVVLRDLSGRPRLLLPLAVRRRGGVRLASVIGGKQADFHMPLLAPDAQLPSAAELKAILIGLGRGPLSVDAFSFTNQPVTWQGRSNPLAEGGQPSPSNAYRLALEHDAEATLQRAFSSQARKKLRSKERKLAEKGEVTHAVARTAAEIDRFLAAFHAQKSARFRQLGIHDPFGRPGVADFLRTACLAGLDRGEPAIELHALLAGERIAAVIGAAADRDRACGMFISFDDDPDVARSSPGDLLLRAVIAFQCGRGRRLFDLGVGEAQYKALCNDVEELVDTFVPVTARGQAYAVAMAGYVGVKRWVKQTPWAWRLVTFLRRQGVSPIP